MEGHSEDIDNEDYHQQHHSSHQLEELVVTTALVQEQESRSDPLDLIGSEDDDLDPSSSSRPRSRQRTADADCPRTYKTRRLFWLLTLVILAVTCCSAVIYGASLKEGVGESETASALYRRLFRYPSEVAKGPKSGHRIRPTGGERPPQLQRSFGDQPRRTEATEGDDMWQFQRLETDVLPEVIGAEADVAVKIASGAQIAGQPQPHLVISEVQPTEQPQLLVALSSRRNRHRPSLTTTTEATTTTSTTTRRPTRRAGTIRPRKTPSSTPPAESVTVATEDALVVPALRSSDPLADFWASISGMAKTTDDVEDRRVAADEGNAVEGKNAQNVSMTRSGRRSSQQATGQKSRRKPKRKHRRRIQSLPNVGYERKGRLRSMCSMGPVCIGQKHSNVTAPTKGCQGESDQLTIRALTMDPETKFTVVSVQGFDTKRALCFNKHGVLVVKRLGPKVPPLCQFLEEPSNDHRLRYRSRKHEHWRLSFDHDGRPRSYCPPNDRQCRIEHRQTRNHRQCTKFSFSKWNRQASTDLTNKELLDILDRAHPGQGIKEVFIPRSSS